MLDTAGDDDGRAVCSAGDGNLEQRSGLRERPERTTVVVEGVEDSGGRGDEDFVEAVSVEVGDCEVEGEVASGVGLPEEGAGGRMAEDATVVAAGDNSGARGNGCRTEVVGGVAYGEGGHEEE